MNLILWDNDLADEVERIEEAFGARKDCQIAGLKEGVKIDYPADTPVKGVLLTALHSGWLKYHAEITEKYPSVTHWVFCVVGMSGDALIRATSRQFEGIASSDVYCELIFDDIGFSRLTEKLAAPTKVNKKCLVVSLNTDLVEDVKEVLQGYLPDWEVAASTESEPDYSLCDGVIVVGNSVEEMAVARPELPSVRVCFWMNEPYFKNKTDLSVDKVMLGKQMNAIGWNIGAYDSIVFFSSIHHEQAYRQICEEKMTPVALKSDPLFVLWDDYGLPMVQSGLEDEALILFLKSHTVFQKMVDLVCTNRKGRNINEI